MRIVIIGAGYVGLVSGACLADFGQEVICVDTDVGKIAALQAGRVPIYEPGLGELVAANQSARRLAFTTSLKDAGQGAKAIFIAVGTPSLAEVGSAGRPNSLYQELADRDRCANSRIPTDIIRPG